MHEDKSARIMRTLALTLASLTLLATGRATTLSRLSLSDMILKSTAIVHAKVTGSYTGMRGPDIFTYYRIQVSETLKGSLQPGAQVDVAVPGGSAKGLRQVVPGAPNLETGADYVLFLWTSRSGLSQVIGLSQGLFRMTHDSAGNAIMIRPAATELMLDKNGNAVTDKTTTLRWTDVRSQIHQTLGGN